MNTMVATLLMKFQFCPPAASAEFYELLMQFALNLVVLVILSRALYFRWNPNPVYVFAQLITGVIVFLICAMLRWVQLELGLVLGLFAIFAIIRFRTINVPVKDMAYLFMVVGISAVNALLSASQCLQWIVFANVLLLLLTFILERTFFTKRLARRTITFNHTDLLKPSQHLLLMAQLKELTELDIVRFEIGKVDYVKKQAQIRLYFKDEGNRSFEEGENLPDED